MITDPSAVYRPVEFTGLVVVSYLSEFICLRVMTWDGRFAQDECLSHKNPDTGHLPDEVVMK
jgi:hypothetical protein